MSSPPLTSLPRVSPASRRRRIFAALALCVAALGSACVTPAPPPEPPKPALPPKVAVSEEAARALASALIAAANVGDLDALERLFDWSGLVSRSVGNANVTPVALSALEQRSIAGARTTGVLFQLAKAHDSNTKIRLLRTWEDPAGRWIGLRILQETGFEHMSCLLSLSATGAPRVTDYVLLTQNELASEAGRKLLVAVQPSGTPADQALVREIGVLGDVQMLDASGKFEEAAAKLRALPEASRKQKAFALLAVRIASNLGDEPYGEALRFLLQHHPKDPAALVASIDYYALQESYDEALRVLREVEQITLPDPYFRVLEANMLMAAERTAEAAVAAQRAIEQEPELEDAYWILVGQSLDDENYARTTELLLELRRRFALDLDLEGSEAYADYLLSSEYEKFARATGAERRKTH